MISVRRISSVLRVAFGMAIVAACLACLQPAWAAQNLVADAPGLHAGTISEQSGWAEVYSSADGSSYIDADLASGSVTYNAATKTLTLNAAKGTSSYSDITIQLKGQDINVNLVGASSLDGIYCYAKSVTVKGSGSFTGKFNAWDAGNFTLQSGSINGDISTYGTFSLKGGKVTGNVHADKAVTVSGGTLVGAVDTLGAMSMTGGAISKTGGTEVVLCYGLTMKGGTISAKNTSGGIYVDSTDGHASSFSLSGGKIAIAGTSYAGVVVSGGNLTQTGGTLQVTDTHGDAINVYSRVYRSKKYGGKLAFKGGVLKATVHVPKTSYAISAESMTNSLKNFSAVGRVAKGATFQVGKNQYKVTTDYGSATLTKYGSGKKAVVNTVTYGKYKYMVNGIGANAFKTAAGKKVTSITVKSYLKSIGANAFYGTKSLKSLVFKEFWWQGKYTSKGKLKSIKAYQGVSIAKKAFAKCGASNAKKLKVTFYRSVPKSDAPKYKAFLKSKGMPGGVTVKAS